MAEDWPAARVVAAELRRDGWDDTSVMIQTTRAWLAAGKPADAVKDAERALTLDPDNGEACYLLGLAHGDLDRDGAALQALERACRLDPDNALYAAMKAFIETRGDSGRQAGYARLIAIQNANPADPFIRDLLVRAYLVQAERDWTVVEAGSGGATLVRNVAKALRLGGTDDIPPGSYPTTAQHVKTAAECLNRARALGSDDPELCAAIAELAADVEASGVRRYNATWGETGVSVLAIGGGMMTIGQAPAMGLIGLLAGSAMIAGCFEPQYRTNRILLSRRGQTVGDALLGVAKSHQYGGIAYLMALLFFFPFIAAYKLFLNRGEGWLAQADLPPLETGGPLRPEPEAGTAEPRPEEYAGADPVFLEAEAAVAEAVPAAAEPPPRDAIEEEGEAAEEAAPLPIESVEDYALIQSEAIEDGAPADPRPSLAELASARMRSIGQRLRGLAPHGRPGLSIAAGAALLVVGLVALGLWGMNRFPGETSSASASPAVAAAASQPASRPATAPSSATPAGPASVSGNPRVVDTGTLAFRSATIRISGIAGEGGVPARQMDSFIGEQGGKVTCERLRQGTYLCRTAQGYDLAAAALVNGAARVSGDAPETYREMQSQAQSEHKGIWR